MKAGHHGNKLRGGLERCVCVCVVGGELASAVPVSGGPERLEKGEKGNRVGGARGVSSRSSCCI